MRIIIKEKYDTKENWLIIADEAYSTNAENRDREKSWSYPYFGWEARGDQMNTDMRYEKYAFGKSGKSFVQWWGHLLWG